MKHSWMT